MLEFLRVSYFFGWNYSGFQVLNLESFRGYSSRFNNTVYPRQGEGCVHILNGIAHCSNIVVEYFTKFTNDPYLPFPSFAKDSR